MANTVKLNTEESKPDLDTPPELDTAESRTNYLRGKLDDIMSNIGTIYGERLTQELLKRLEATIQEFHQEVLALLDRLEQLEEDRRKVLKQSEEPQTEGGKEGQDVSPDLSDWEKRLEMLERERAAQSAPEQQSEVVDTAKHSFFGKKGLKK